MTINEKVGYGLALVCGTLLFAGLCYELFSRMNRTKKEEVDPPVEKPVEAEPTYYSPAPPPTDGPPLDEPPEPEPEFEELVQMGLDDLKRQLDAGESHLEFEDRPGIRYAAGDDRVVQFLYEFGWQRYFDINESRDGGQTARFFVLPTGRIEYIFDDHNCLVLGNNRPKGRLDDARYLDSAYFHGGSGEKDWWQTYTGKQCGIAPGVVFSGDIHIDRPCLAVSRKRDVSSRVDYVKMGTHNAKIRIEPNAVAEMRCISAEVIAQMRDMAFKPKRMKAYRSDFKLIVELHDDIGKAFAFSSREAFDYNLDYSDVQHDKLTFLSMLERHGADGTGNPVQIGDTLVYWFDEDKEPVQWTPTPTQAEAS